MKWKHADLVIAVLLALAGIISLVYEAAHNPTGNFLWR
jgi:hypothetical protein